MIARPPAVGGCGVRRPAGAGRRHEWRCVRCGRFLAVVIGAIFETPAGVRANLPAVIPCPRCGKRNRKID